MSNSRPRKPSCYTPRARLPRTRLQLLARLLQTIFATRRGAAAGVTRGVAQSVQPPTLARIRKLIAAAERAPIDEHLRILYEDVQVAGYPLLELARAALEGSRSEHPPLKRILRPLALFNLAKYFLHATTLPGRWAECGVFLGHSALGLCLAARRRLPEFDGTGLHLVDSFEGLSQPTQDDAFELAASGGSARPPPIMPPGRFASDLEGVRATFASFPGVRIHKGWIPEVLAELPDGRWSLVHVDVDLYEPTRACLEYFVPRLVPGGVIVCDDYGSLMFPGAARAWDEVCERRNIPFVELPTGQSVILNA